MQQRTLKWVAILFSAIRATTSPTWLSSHLYINPHIILLSQSHSISNSIHSLCDYQNTVPTRVHLGRLYSFIQTLPLHLAPPNGSGSLVLLLQLCSCAVHKLFRVWRTDHHVCVEDETDPGQIKANSDTLFQAITVHRVETQLDHHSAVLLRVQPSAWKAVPGQFACILSRSMYVHDVADHWQGAIATLSCDQLFQCLLV